MKNLPAKQQGASAIVTIIVLAVLAYGVYVGIQYTPQLIEARSIDSILTTMKTDQRTDPVTTEQAAKAKVLSLLNINEMNDMAKNLRVSRGAGTITIKFSYERELNLGFKKRPMHYEKVLELKL
jgi:hypothetical protein